MLTSCWRLHTGIQSGFEVILATLSFATWLWKDETVAEAQDRDLRSVFKRLIYTYWLAIGKWCLLLELKPGVPQYYRTGECVAMARVFSLHRLIVPSCIMTVPPDNNKNFISDEPYPRGLSLHNFSSLSRNYFLEYPFDARAAPQKGPCLVCLACSNWVSSPSTSCQPPYFFLSTPLNPDIPFLKPHSSASLP